MATVISLTPEQLSTLIQNAVSAALSGSSVSVAVPSKLSKAPKTAKKEVSGEPKAKRTPTAWAAWCKEAKKLYPDDYASWLTENPDLKGPAVQFASFKKTNASDAYAAFVSQFKANSAESASVASADTTDSESVASVPKKTRGRPKMTDEEKKARAAERKAKNSTASDVPVVAVSIPAPSADAGSIDDLTVDTWTHPVTGIVYQRSNQNHLWLDDSGELGEWAGILDPVTLKIDDSADAPNLD